MSGLEADTIGGYNSMLAKQQKEAGKAIVTTVFLMINMKISMIEWFFISKIKMEDEYVLG